MINQGTIVIKVGTDVLQYDPAFYAIATQIAHLKRLDFGAILISSGGVAAGGARISNLGGEVQDYHKRFRASCGARHLLNKWGEAFALGRMDVAQCYVTYGNLRLRGERESIRSSLRRLALDPFFIPIVNENDIVSGVEIEKMRRGLGDNDRLARIIACLVQATTIVFVTAKGGVYTANPDTDASAKLIPLIDAKRRYRRAKKNAGASSNGTGGMTSKVNQASICARKGMRAGIIGFRDISAFLGGKKVGTRVSL